MDHVSLDLIATVAAVIIAAIKLAEVGYDFVENTMAVGSLPFIVHFFRMVLSQSKISAIALVG